MNGTGRLKRMKKSVMMIPADFIPESAEKFAELNRAYEASGLVISELYGSLNPSPFGVTKNPKNLKKVDFETLRRYCEALRKHGIEFNYILNFLCYGGKEFSTDGTKQILSYVKKLYDLGIRRFTVANPVIAQAMSIRFPEIHISISVVQNTGTKLKLRTYAGIQAVDRVYISEDMIRDFEAIRQLHEEAADQGVELATLLNSFCLIDCPYKVNHANVDGHLVDGCEQDMQHYFYAWCSLQKLNHPREILRLQAIRPEEISLFEEAGVTAFKLAGRELPGADFLKAARGYMSRSYDGNLMDLIAVYSDNFFREIYRIENRLLDGRLQEMKDRKAVCRNHSNCEGCTICEKYLPAVMVNETQLEKYRKIFRRSYDRYTEQIKALRFENENV